MYATTVSPPIARGRNRANGWARWLAIPTRKLFRGNPMPDLQVPVKATQDFPELVAAAAASAQSRSALNVIQ